MPLQKYSEQLVNMAQSGLVVINRDAKVIYANPAAVKMFGWRRYNSADPEKHPYYLFDKSRGRLLSNHDSYALLIQNPLDKVLKQKKSIKNKEIIWQKKSGKLIYFSISAIPQPKNGGALLSFSNISPYKSEVRWRQHLMRVVGHELKNPLASILALTETISFLNSDNDEDKRSEYLDKIKQRVRSTTRLVNDFLDTTRLRSGDLQFRDRPQPFEPFIKRLADDFQLSNPTHWITVEGSCNYNVNFDAIRITQVIENLLSNAVKYSEPGSEIKIIMSTDRQQKPKYVSVTVADEGEGIEPKEFKKIFQLYYQVGSTNKSKQQKGLGLGLFLVKQILHHYGSQPIIKSEVGKGTSISFSLPITYQQEVTNL